MDIKIVALVVLISVVCVSEAKPYEEFRKFFFYFKRSTIESNFKDIEDPAVSFIYFFHDISSIKDGLEGIQNYLSPLVNLTLNQLIRKKLYVKSKIGSFEVSNF